MKKRLSIILCFAITLATAQDRIEITIDNTPSIKFFDKNGNEKKQEQLNLLDGKGEIVIDNKINSNMYSIIFDKPSINNFKINKPDASKITKYKILSDGSLEPTIANGKYINYMDISLNNSDGKIASIKAVDNNIDASKKVVKDNEIENVERYTGIAFWDADIIYRNLADKTCGSDDIKKLITTIAKQYDYNGMITDYTSFATLPFFKKLNAFNCKPDDFAGNGVMNKKTKYIKNETTGKLIAITESENGTPTLVEGLLGSSSGIDVTKYVQAFADFLRDRIKEELAVAYIDKLNKILNDHAEFQYLMPQTLSVFKNSDVFNIPSMGPAYKAALAQDLQDLVKNFETMVLSMDEYKPWRNDVFVAAMFGYHYADMSSKGYHPIDIFHTVNSTLGYKKELGDVGLNNTASYLLSTTNMLSDNLKDTSGNGWIKREHLNLVNKDFTYIFLGLLYLQNKDLFNATTGKQSLLDNLESAKANDVMDKLFAFLTTAKNIDTHINAYNKMTADEKKKNAVTFFANNLDVIPEILTTIGTLTTVNQKQLASVEKWKKITGYASNIAKAATDTSTISIGKIASNSLQIISEVLNTPEKANLIAQITIVTKFITDITAAKSAKEIKKVIELAAAPPHSYKVNRQSKFTFSLASYAGVYAGFERSKQVERGKFKDNSFGITAPIGLALNWGGKKGKEGKEAASCGIFLSMLDIGAALSYRWNNDTTDIPNKITLGQIFAPGIHLVYGVKGSPLAFKVGYQYAPQLRTIKSDANVVMDKADIWRLSVGLSIDIPVFIFSHKKH